jgi:uncharacterized membrane protein
MSWITTGIDYLGVGIFCIGGLAILAQAFGRSTGWGIAMLLLGGILWPVFVLINWKESSYWFFFCLTGVLIVYIF